MENFGIRNEKGKNKGFSLVEILVAIAILAVIITPVLNSFITSASVNKKARHLMAATDLAQSVVEGFKGKTYEEISAALDASGAGMVSANSLTTVNNNFFNVSGNSASINALAASQATVLNNHVTSKVNAPGNLGSSSSQQYDINKDTYIACIASMATSGGSGAKLVWHKSEHAIFMTYFGVMVENYQFDCVISIVPAADKATDIYYPYSVVVSVYDCGTGITRDTAKVESGQVIPMMVLDTGIRNKNGK